MFVPARALVFAKQKFHPSATSPRQLQAWIWAQLDGLNVAASSIQPDTHPDRLDGHQCCILDLCLLNKEDIRAERMQAALMAKITLYAIHVVLAKLYTKTCACAFEV